VQHPVSFPALLTAVGVDAQGDSYFAVSGIGPVDWGAGPVGVQQAELLHHIVSYQLDASLRWSKVYGSVGFVSGLAVDPKRKLCAISPALEDDAPILNPEQSSGQSLRCFDLEGQPLWRRRVGESFALYAPAQLAFDAEGNVYFTGYRTGPGPLIESVTPDGTLRWTMPTQTSDTTRGLALQALPDGNLACVVHFESSLQLATMQFSSIAASMALLVLDPAGALVWAQTFEDDSDVARLSATPAGDITVATRTQTRRYDRRGALFVAAPGMLGSIVTYGDGILGAQSWVASDGEARVLLTRVDDQLRPSWSALYAHAGAEPEPTPLSTEQRFPADLAVTDSGAVFIAGRAQRTVDNSVVSREWFLLRMQLSPP
jgi:hypothetical protein